MALVHQRGAALESGVENGACVLDHDLVRNAIGEAQGDLVRIVHGA